MRKISKTSLRNRINQIQKQEGVLANRLIEAGLARLGDCPISDLRQSQDLLIVAIQYCKLLDVEYNLQQELDKITGENYNKHIIF
jgi:hypothetical protein